MGMRVLWSSGLWDHTTPRLFGEVHRTPWRYGRLMVGNTV
jgi:hypothetical protein